MSDVLLITYPILLGITCCMVIWQKKALLKAYNERDYYKCKFNDLNASIVAYANKLSEDK